MRRNSGRKSLRFTKNASEISAGQWNDAAATIEHVWKELHDGKL
jgi:hypothetical protein